MKPIRAFILAAGLGERLRPITSHTPKPLLPVLGTPVLDIILRNISRFPVNGIGINMCYQWQMISDWVAQSHFSERVTLFHEKEVLGTGGGLRNAKSFLSTSIFLVHNADILTDIPLDPLVEHHLTSGNVVTLAVHDHNRFNNVWIDNDARLQAVGAYAPQGKTKWKRVAFTGIAVYSPVFCNLLPEGKSSVVDSWLKAAEEGMKVGTVDFTGCKWTDIGTPEDYATLVFETLSNNGETAFVHPSVDCTGLKIESQVVIEKGCIIEPDASLKHCLILPNSSIKKGIDLQNRIIGPDYEIKIREPFHANLNNISYPWLKDFLGNASGNGEVKCIGTGGSDRNYYRIHNNGKTSVLMECAGSFPDYERHIEYTRFFSRYSVPVPELLWAEERPQANTIHAVFEDLGDTTLYTWLKCNNSLHAIRQAYMGVLEILAHLHTVVTIHISECPLLESRVFDYDHLRWETDYFVEWFVEGECGITIKNRDLLVREFDMLARHVASFQKTIVHRDLQSQNIMLWKGILRVIDFQGARNGPPAYDLASFLWDPYTELDAGLRDELICYYIGRVSSYSEAPLDEDCFSQTILYCRLQRHMQALGAYAFLSRVKGKRFFLKYIPKALKYLYQEAELVKTEYPFIYSLLNEIHEKTPY